MFWVDIKAVVSEDQLLICLNQINFLSFMHFMKGCCVSKFIQTDLAEIDLFNPFEVFPTDMQLAV